MSTTNLMSSVVIAPMTLGVTPTFAADKGGLDISVYNPGENAVFAVSSEIVSGPSEVVLVDAQFAKADAEARLSRSRRPARR